MKKLFQFDTPVARCERQLPSVAQLRAINESLALLAYLINVGDRKEVFLILIILILTRRRETGRLLAS